MTVYNLILKQMKLAITCSVPGEQKSSTSVFREESRLTGDFFPSISGIVISLLQSNLVRQLVSRL